MPFDALPPSLNLREVIPGRLWRGAAPVLWAPARWHEFALTAGLRLVVDLRMTPERERQGTTPMPTDCELEALPLFESPLPDWEHPDDKSPSATAARYLAMAEAGRQALCTIAERFERGTGPLFVHCAAGRDRTGIVVACLLALEGVPEEDIVDDYALSDLVVADGGRAHPETMLKFLRLVRDRYGSFEGFLSR